MKAFAETVAALGQPRLVRRIGSAASPQAIIARWKHGDARVQTHSVDALRVCLSLRDGHTVRHGHGPEDARTIVGGSIAILAADRFSDVRIEGQADVLQVFFDAGYVDQAAGFRAIVEPSFGVHDIELHAAILRLLVGAQRGGPDDDLLIEVDLWHIVERLVRRRVPDKRMPIRAGMAPSAIRRIDELIASRFDTEAMRAPSIAHMASAAAMSASHFIRAFKQSTGVTPHQYVLTRRIELAMGLLARPDYSVAEVADSTGYASPAHFVASFRQRLGMTPGSYRHVVMR